MKPYSFIGIVVLLLILSSCHKERDLGEGVSSRIAYDQDISSIQIPITQVPLYADLTDYNLLPGRPQTRSVNETVSLESLLNKEEEKQISFKGATLTLVPFIQNNEPILAGIGESLEEGLENATCVKKYYVSTVNEEYTGAFVVSMITSNQYYQTYPDFDYFNMPNYSGAILFSTLEGELKDSRVYRGGKIEQAFPINPNKEVSDSTEIVYITLAEQRPETRQDIGEYITASICTGLGVKHGYGWINPSWCFGYLSTTGGGAGSNGGNVVPGHGAGNGPDQQGADEPGEQVLPNLPPISIEFDVKLSSNIPEYVEMLGSGRYPLGSVVPIEYQLTSLVIKEPEFSFWTGTFAGEKTAVFLEILVRDVESTAYFEVQEPCGSGLGGVTNPLIEMRIAATASGSYVNGTFNAYRGKSKKTGKDKYHQGVDFYANEGTATYAIASGRVVSVLTGAPDRESNYNGGYGNVIIIACDVAINHYNDDGQFETTKTLYLQYSHLQAGNPVAINYRTGEPFKKDDPVYRGDLIGYTGRTGNAYEGVPNPHLHLGASFEINADGKIPPDSWIDVMLYINGTIDMAELENDFGTPNKGQLKNIICY